MEIELEKDEREIEKDGPHYVEADSNDEDDDDYDNYNDVEDLSMVSNKII